MNILENINMIIIEVLCSLSQRGKELEIGSIGDAFLFM
jgi:hypothetical protein